MRISHLDHLVLTVKDIQRTCEFYHRILNFEVIAFNENRKALKFGYQKINLHQINHTFEPKAKMPTAGSADLCFISNTLLNEVIQHLNYHRIKIK